MTNYNSRYRDSFFRSYFNEPVRLLSLCNAVLGTQYTNLDKLNINTLEDIFFDKQKTMDCHNHCCNIVGTFPTTARLSAKSKKVFELDCRDATLSAVPLNFLSTMA